MYSAHILFDVASYGREVGGGAGCWILLQLASGDVMGRTTVLYLSDNANSRQRGPAPPDTLHSGAREPGKGCAG